MNILVTGGKGFIGTHLVRKLKKKHDVEVLDLKDNQNINLNPLHELTDFEPDYIYHLAACVGVVKTRAKPFEVMDDYQGTYNVLKYARLHDAKIIYTSSSEVYGYQTPMPMSEDFISPHCPYAVEKLMSETLLSISSVPSLVFRLFNVYGPWQSDQFVIGSWMKQIKDQYHKNCQISVKVPDILHARDFLYVDDCVKILIKALQWNETGVYNLGRGIPVPLEQLIKILEKVVRRTIIPITSDNPTIKRKVKRRWADVTELQELFYRNEFTMNWTTLEKGLRKTWRWYHAR